MLGGRSVAERFGAKAQAEIVSAVRVAEGPTEGDRTPAIAIHKLLSKQDMHVDQIYAIEIKETYNTSAQDTTMLCGDREQDRPERHRRSNHPQARQLDRRTSQGDNQ